MTNTKKVTKKDNYSVISNIISLAETNGFELPEGYTYESLTEFIKNEIHILEAKTASAQKRAAAKKEAGDLLREKVYDVLSTDEYMTTPDIVTMIGDPEVSDPMVIARLKQLVDLGRVEKDTVNVPPATENGKARKRTGYRRIG